MIDIRLIRENKELVKENIKKKFQDHKLPLVDEVYDLDIQFREAKQEAEFWVEDNEGKGHYAIFLSVTTEEEVRELLKGFSKQFYEAHKEFQDPRDEYTLSHVSNADMVVEELVSTF